MGRTGARNATVAAGHNQQCLLKQDRADEAASTHLKMGLHSWSAFLPNFTLVITCSLLIVPPFIICPAAVIMALLAH